MRLAATIVALFAAAPAHVVFGDRSAGGIVMLRTTAPQAAALYGAPATSRARGTSCLRSWPKAGLVVDFLSFGGPPCTKGVAVTITLTGDTWRTRRGLFIGDPLIRIHDFFPYATRHADGWWLVTRHACAKVGGTKYPGLLAHVVAGEVRSLVLQAGICE
jgi:hypothetical protein